MIIIKTEAFLCPEEFCQLILRRKFGDKLYKIFQEADVPNCTSLLSSCRWYCDTVCNKILADATPCKGYKSLPKRTVS